MCGMCTIVLAALAGWCLLLVSSNTEINGGHNLWESLQALPASCTGGGDASPSLTVTVREGVHLLQPASGVGSSNDSRLPPGAAAPWPLLNLSCDLILRGVPNPGTQLLPTLVLPLQSGIIAPGAAGLQLQGLVLLDLPPGPLESLPSGMASVLGWTWVLNRAPPPPSFDWSLDPLDSCSNHTATWATHPVTAATGTATRTKGALGPDAAPAASSSMPGGEGAKPAAGSAGGAEWAAASVTLADCVLVLPDDEVAYWAAWLWPSALSDRMDWPSQQAEQAARQWLTRARGSAGGSQAAGEGWGCPPAAPGLRSWLQQLGMGLPRACGC
ncbi:hypothetical protein V8C86DRAFT_195804 [Haematococcus lacustris]